MSSYIEKTAQEAGADQHTPSIPQYFSWINNSNEGSTEQQTLINLEFFAYMKETYGMQIKLYAWDAGNFDGSRKHYGAQELAKLRRQYPNGYEPLVKKAAQYGIRLGLWGSPDGFGDDEKTERERIEFFVHLCRDYHFGLFKLDGVCGTLREEKAPVFAAMLRECRKYSPDLVVLNHRLDLYEAEKYITTFLFNGAETYVDVHSYNKITAMHHRAFMFSRGHVEGLNRLAEDHGVCISSANDYFEDELVYQAFSRCLILAPEIYGNPWLLRDDELPKLARVYNLHRRNAAILTEGMLLDEKYGCNAIARGDGTKRFICTGNDTWQTKTISLKLSDTGIEKADGITVNLHHPYEKQLGTFSYDDEVEIELMPFRATLIEVAWQQKSEIMLPGCEYEIIRESEDGTPVQVKLFCGTTDKCDTVKAVKENAPRFLATLDKESFEPEDGEFLYESAMFAITNDALESRSLKRCGETAIPQLKAARDAFFSQELYHLRGCESSAMFDGDPDTFFDGVSRGYCGVNLRCFDGCLRVDFGSIFEADTLEVECFIPDKPTDEIPFSSIPCHAEFSTDRRDWQCAAFPQISVTDCALKTVRNTIHDVYTAPGKRTKICYPIGGAVRYIRIAQPGDRIFSVRLIKDGSYLQPVDPFGNIMQAHYRYKKTELVKEAQITLPLIDRPSKIALAAEGKHYKEQLYCVLEHDGKTEGFPERAPDYIACMWEHRVAQSDENNTFFFPIDESYSGKTVTVKALFTDRDCTDVTCQAYLCDSHLI